MLSRLRIVLAAGLFLALAYAGLRPVGRLPALGELLNPAAGIWGLARHTELSGSLNARIPGLTAPVDVVYDDRGVPHIFAATELDAWRAAGFVTARDRLFQLEATWRASAGRLSEWFGPRALEADREARRFGLPWGAERLFARADTAALGRRSADAYAQGVNAWIDAMPRGALPLEYRLLGVRPARWEPRFTTYVLLRMGRTLASQDEALDKLRARALVGAEAADALFPVDNPIQEPIQPNGLGRPRIALRKLPPPGAPDPGVEFALQRSEQSPALGSAPADRDGEVLGSNNWAVGPRRAAGRRALLAGDPHLELSLPSVWYEMHVVVPDTLDVAGVTFPGTPGVLIGFNRNVAWSFTNTGADVLDLYAETVDDPARPSRYRLDGAWRPLEVSVETYRGPDGRTLAVDTLRFTHRGPMQRTDSLWYSMRWTLYEGRPERGDFQRLNRAGSVGEWLELWSEFEGPAQNGLVADRRGTIAIRSTGRYPVRPGDGRGDVIRDGSASSADWTGYLTLEHYPMSLNPEQGFLASANQQPVDPRVNPRYFGANWYPGWRALRINELLRADSAVTPDAMRRYQTDPGNSRADLFVPRLLAAALAADRGGWATDSLRFAARLLSEWDRRYTRDNERAVLFEGTMSALGRLVWDELVPAGAGGDAPPTVAPSPAVLLELLDDPASAWWDDRRTPVREDRDRTVARALEQGLRTTIGRHGAPEAGGWKWERVRHANIHHLLRLRPFSALEIPVQGGNGSLNPSSGSGIFGASWRMVVELGDSVAAMAVYPGGQSGNPASSRYTDRITKWSAGLLEPVLMPRSAAALPASRISARLRLRP